MVDPDEWSRRDFLRRAGGAAALAALMATGACAPAAAPSAGGATPQPQPSKGGTVVEGNSLPVVEFNPVNRTNTPHNINVPLVLECLYAAAPNGDIQPRLAAALPTIAGDGLTYTVTLRKNLIWSDGQPLNADDVVFTYNLIIDPQYGQVPSAWRSDFTKILASVQSTDPLTVVFRLKSPDAPFVARLVNVDIAPKHVLGALGPAQIQAAFAEPPQVVSGVFKIVDWAKGDYIKYGRNDSFYDGPSLLDGYVYKVVAQTTALLSQLKTGEIDVARIPSPGVFDELKAIPNVGVALIPANFTHGYAYNLDPAKPASKIFSSKIVRQALIYALDREGIVKGVFFGYANVQDSIWIPGTWAYSAPKTSYPYDAQKAAAMLDADGWKMGSSGIREKNGVPLKFELSTATGTPELPLVAAAMQQNWKQIGADVSIKQLAQPDWAQQTRVDRNFDVIYAGTSTFLDPDLSSEFHSRNVVAGGGNSASYINPTVDKLLDQAAATSDREQRKQLYAQVQDILLDDVPVPGEVLQQYAWAYNKRVSGMGANGEVGVYNIIAQRTGMNKVFVTS